MCIADLLATEVVINYYTDQFPEETSIKLSKGNTFESLYERSGEGLSPNQLYSDTIIIEEEQLVCLLFEIKDEGADGLTSDGKVELIVDNELLYTAKHFGAYYNYNINCESRDICQEAERVFEGTLDLVGKTNYWFKVDVYETRFYDIKTISDCDTKIWIYDDCLTVHPTDQTGAIIFNDDLSNKNAGVNQFRILINEDYYVRVEVEGSCDTASISFVNLGLREGCMDPESCNFDPLANLPLDNCVYGDCHPDLVINQTVLRESLALDSLVNTNECLIEEGCLGDYGVRHILKFTTQLENIGDADYIVGTPDEDSELFSRDNCHRHWHYLGYAEYLLFDNEGNPQPIGFKNGFCALDYRCEDESLYKYTCDYMGISAGCYDVYNSDLLCQWVDLTDVESGFYTLVVRVNHNQAVDFFGRQELDYDNNWAQVCLDISRPNGKLDILIIDDCPSYTDCTGVAFGDATKDCNGVCDGDSRFGDINSDNKLDQADLEEYRLKMKNGELQSQSCFDLDANSQITIYDYLLLSDCVQNFDSEDSELTSINCDFPRSVSNVQDSVFLSISSDNNSNDFIQVDYISNVPFMAGEFYISNVIIDSVVSINGAMISSLSKDDHVSFYMDNEADYFSKSIEPSPLLRVYYSSSIEPVACLSGNHEVVNANLEKMVSGYMGECLDLITTATDDISYDQNIDIYPNPSHDDITLYSESLSNSYNWIIYDRLGRVVLSSTEGQIQSVSINISDLSNGVYFIHAFDDSVRLSRKFVKL